MTRIAYKGSPDNCERVWAGLKAAGCGSVFAIPFGAPREVLVNIGHVDLAQRWLSENGWTKTKVAAVERPAPAAAAAPTPIVQQGLLF